MERLTGEQRALLREITDDPVLMETARKAVEDELIDLRDRCMWIGLHYNGLVVNEKDGTPSTVIRMGIADALRIALSAMAGDEDDPGEEVTGMNVKTTITVQPKAGQDYGHADPDAQFGEKGGPMENPSVREAYDEHMRNGGR